ncbi:hypothetical protein [Alteromonas sp. H39]|uniref:hypothetical protein n=1 Tax=Alteromonas sp. H39 TaxID=3389876 RepID=UPI0039E000C2
MSASLAVICHQLDTDTDDTTNQLLNGIASQGVETTLYSSQDVITNIDELEKYSGFVFEAASSQSLDKIVDAFNGAALLRNKAGLWRDKLAAGFSQGAQSAAVSLRAMIDFSFFCNSQNMIWLSSGIDNVGAGQATKKNTAAMGNAPVLDDVMCQAYRHGQYLAQVAKQWQPDR